MHLLMTRLSPGGFGGNSASMFASEAFGVPPTPLFVPCALPAGWDGAPAGPPVLQWQPHEDMGVPNLKHFPHA
jgi:hypothetical protein